jgi:hypothetical protein
VSKLDIGHFARTADNEAIAPPKRRHKREREPMLFIAYWKTNPPGAAPK